MFAWVLLATLLCINAEITHGSFSSTKCPLFVNLIGKDVRSSDNDLHNLLAQNPADRASPFKNMMQHGLQKRLPWSSNLFKSFKMAQSKELAELRPPLDSAATTMAKVKLLFPFLDHPWVKPLLQKLSPVGGIFFQWMQNNKSNFLFGGKAFIGLYFALSIIRRIIHWYTGVAEYELLLDQHDFDYQTYGVHLDSFGAWILSRIDKSHVENFGYKDLYYRIDTAMNKPCFPYAMNTYALHMGNELSEMVNSLDIKLRSIRRQHHLARKEYDHLQQQTSWSLSSKREHKILRSQGAKLSTRLQGLRKESDITFLFQKLLLIISVRQADAYLRTTRMLILAEANNCEDLLKTWKDVVAKQSQTLRIPLFQTLLVKLLGFTTGSRTVATQQTYKAIRRNSSIAPSLATNHTDNRSPQSTDKQNALYSSNVVMKDLNAKEKVVLLENILKNLYTVTGRIQQHLESLQPLSLVLARANDDVLRQDHVWQQLEQWVTQSSSLTLEAVHVLSFQSDTLAANAGDSFSSISNNKFSSASSRNDFSASSWEIKPVISPAFKYYDNVLNCDLSFNKNVSQELLPSKDKQSAFNISIPPAQYLSPFDFATTHPISNYNKVNVLPKSQRRKPLGLTPKTLSLLCLLSSSVVNMDSSVLRSFSPALEFLVPIPPKELIEKGVITSSLWQKSIESSGGKDVVIRPWHHLYPPSSEVNRTHSSYKYFAIREMSFRQSTVNQTPLSLLWQQSTVVQLLNLIPQQSISPSSQKHRKDYMMTTFHQYFTKLPMPTAANDNVDLPLVNDMSANTCNTTTRWVFAPASEEDVAALKQTLLFPPSIAFSTSSFVSNWLMPVKNKRSPSSDQGQWTKVSVSINVQVHSAIYKYVIASLARTEMETLVNCWRKALMESLIQRGWMLKATATENSREESTHEDILQLKLFLEKTLSTGLNDMTSSRLLNNVVSSSGSSHFTSNTHNITAEINGVEVIPSSDVTPVTNDSITDKNIVPPVVSLPFRTNRNKRSPFVVVGSLLYHIDSMLSSQEAQITSLSNSWQTSGVILKDLTRVSRTFANHLHSMGLKKRMPQGIYAILRFRVLVTLTFWTSLALAGFELNKRSEDITWGADFLWKTFKRFIKRRIATPTWSIVNDVILNKRMKITDAAALSDAKRSLRAMLYDFLQQHNPNLSESERQQLAANMDMRPISEEYENQLKHPMRNIVSGSIARLVLIQLQFLKKELLVAMQAIDELFNANQVNLQLLAVSPAIMAIFALQVMGRLVTSLVKASTKGKGNMMESASHVFREVKSHLRDMERILVNSDAYREVNFGRHSPVTASINASLNASSSNEGSSVSISPDLTPAEWGRLLSVLYRVHLLIMIHSGNFEAHNLQQLQEDLRDVTHPHLSVQQRLSVLERMHRHYTFLNAPRRMFGGGFMQ